MKHTLTTQLGIGIAFFFLVLGALMMDAQASDSPTPQDYANLEDIKNNQKVLEETREAHERFMQAKAWNESEVENLSRDGWCPSWNPDPQKITLVQCKAEPIHAAAGYDLDKLAKAVAMHETKDCGVNVGSALVNNCFGIRGWHKDGTPYFKKYATKEDSYKDFKRIWTAYYGKFPDTALAKKYSGNDRPQSWLANVTHYYETL